MAHLTENPLLLMAKAIPILDPSMDLGAPECVQFLVDVRVIKANVCCCLPHRWLLNITPILYRDGSFSFGWHDIFLLVYAQITVIRHGPTRGT